MAIANKAPFRFVPFSKKQRQILTWWVKGVNEKTGQPLSPHAEKDVIIADGAVRSGKSLIMSLSYVLWGMENFNYVNFGMAGKTVGSFKRNVWLLLKLMLRLRGYSVAKIPDTDSSNAFVVRKGDVENYYYIFGGKDERSQDYVAGFTAAGFFFDEVTLMPENFVNQCVARCSVEDAKIWFNCNPDGPFHWFMKEWIEQLDAKNAVRISFLMEDNPSLSKKVKERYKRSFSGVFYDRYILGLWVVAEGIIYSMFRKEMVIPRVPKGVKINKRWVGIDYGQSNATVFLLIGLGSDDRLYILDEYYHVGKESQIQKSPSKYAKDFKKWLIKNGVEGMPVVTDKKFIDPSAKGFMLQMHEEGVRGIWQADNEVLKGIELISSVIDNDMLRVLAHCKFTIRELSAYSWDPKAQERGEDKPIKQNDHALDALRYVANGIRMILQKLIVENQRKAA